MGHLMFTHVLAAVEERRAEGTPEFIFALRTVDVELVGLQIGQDGEATATGGTLVRLLARVYPLVALYVRLGCKRLPAEPAGKSARPLVVTLVGLEPANVREEFPTLSTEAPFCFVR